MIRQVVAMSLFLAASAIAQQAPPVATNSIEVTETDFTARGQIRSTDLRTFGIYLGQSQKDAEAAAFAANVDLRAVGIFEPRICCAIYRKGVEVAGIRFLDGKVETVIWQPAMARLLAGASGQLLDPSAAQPESGTRLKLLGREDSRSRQGSLIVYAYDREGIRVALDTDGQAKVFVVQPARAR